MSVGQGNGHPPIVCLAPADWFGTASGAQQACSNSIGQVVSLLSGIFALAMFRAARPRFTPSTSDDTLAVCKSFGDGGESVPRDAGDATAGTAGEKG